MYGDRIKCNNSILIKEHGEYYLSYEFVKRNIDDELYFDNIAKKVVISSDKGLAKIKINDKKINFNSQDEIINNKGVIEKNDKYISMEVLDKAYNIDSTAYKNTIYLYKEGSFDGKIKYNNVSLYKEGNIKGRIVDYVDKEERIQVISEKDSFVLVKTNNKIGYALKNAIKYTIKTENMREQSKKNNNIYFFADENNKTIGGNLPITGIILDMFDVTQTSARINENNINKSFLNKVKQYDYCLYGKIGNGYNLAGFNTATMSQILSDETKRINLINNLNEKIKEYNLDGVVLDFRKIKEKDISNYIQFIKELKAFSNKTVIVNIDDSEYKNYINVINYTDFSIINTYNQRNLKSTVAGSISEIGWMKNIIETCLNKANEEKIVIGIPAYTILWTEKDSNVIDAQIYNFKAIQNYIEKNNLKLKQINKQNYTELKKGSLTYRMWVEDEISLNNRLNIIKQNKLNGIAVHKLGYQNESFIDILKNKYY